MHGNYPNPFNRWTGDAGLGMLGADDTIKNKAFHPHVRRRSLFTNKALVTFA